jgi:hypothetical protein
LLLSPPWSSVTIFAATMARWLSLRCRRFMYRPARRFRYFTNLSVTNSL